MADEVVEEEAATLQRKAAKRLRKEEKKRKAAEMEIEGTTAAAAADEEEVELVEDEEHEKQRRRKEKREKKKKAKRSGEDEAASVAEEEEKREKKEMVIAQAPENATTKIYPPAKVEPIDTTILLFYAYCEPQMTRPQQDKMIADCHACLTSLGITGRLRVAREGFNATLTGPTTAIREFTTFLRKADPKTFGETDFKYVDGQTRNKRLKDLKVWPVKEIVTYGFDPLDAPLDMRGTHLSPREFHKAMEDEDSIMIDVRNFNESLIGKFQPKKVPVLDPEMRRSTEFPEWVDTHKKDLEGKKVLMYCTGGVRCERASAFMRSRGVQNVFQLEGGIHRYLDEFPEDGGYWVGKNYTFDKRFSHGAKQSEVISSCVACKQPWDRYQAQESCHKCQMEVIVCKTCQKAGVNKKNLKCPLCE